MADPETIYLAMPLFISSFGNVTCSRIHTQENFDSSTALDIATKKPRISFSHDSNVLYKIRRIPESEVSGLWYGRDELEYIDLQNLLTINLHKTNQLHDKTGDDHCLRGLEPFLDEDEEEARHSVVQKVLTEQDLLTIWGRIDPKRLAAVSIAETCMHTETARLNGLRDEVEASAAIVKHRKREKKEGKYSSSVSNAKTTRRIEQSVCLDGSSRERKIIADQTRRFVQESPKTTVITAPKTKYRKASVEKARDQCLSTIFSWAKFVAERQILSEGSPSQKEMS